MIEAARDSVDFNRKGENLMEIMAIFAGIVLLVIVVAGAVVSGTMAGVFGVIGMDDDEDEM